MASLSVQVQKPKPKPNKPSLSLGLLKAEGLVSNQCGFDCSIKNLVVSVNIAATSAWISLTVNLTLYMNQKISRSCL